MLDWFNVVLLIELMLGCSIDWLVRFATDVLLLLVLLLLGVSICVVVIELFNDCC